MKQAPPDPDPDAPPRIDLAAPWRWLALGWRDLRTNPVPGLVHGAVAAAFGWLLLQVAQGQFWWLMGAFSALFLLAPLFLVGLLQVSRQAQLGRRVGLAAVWQLWRSVEPRLVLFGVLLGLAGMAWVLTSAGLLLVLAPQPISNLDDFIQHVVLAPNDWLFELWLMALALLAAPVFASSVATLALLIDTAQPLPVAVAHSWRVVALYPAVMALWALLIALLVTLGLFTYLLGLIVLLPWLGHATWHAYVELKRAGSFGLPGSWGGVK